MIAASLLACAVVPSTEAQTFFGVGAGLDLSRPGSPSVPGYFNGNVSPGFTVQGFVGAQLSKRFGMRLEASVNDVPQSKPQLAGVLCMDRRPPGACCGICPIGGTSASAATLVSVSGVVTVTRPSSSSRVYVLAGGGPAFMWRNGYVASATWLSVSAGAGCAMSARGRLRVFVEARFEDFVNASSWTVPVTVGLQF